MPIAALFVVRVLELDAHAGRLVAGRGLLDDDLDTATGAERLGEAVDGQREHELLPMSNGGSVRMNVPPLEMFRV